ncbi:hypothetical protein RN001_006362 [Aquatica leii]|uniref:CCHC-type domain-containing protein n=1 Tax=Aquatica leii TaxID=1421715 RepID=A0AAN7PE00_9COLE|nr:hypothetical protein RN001_006362 [Aquatica leii]
MEFKLDVDRLLRDELEYELQIRRIDYSATMTCLFDRMPISVSNELRLKVLRGNILLFYQERLVLLDINTTTELINYCRKLEETKLKVKEFKPPQEGQLTLEPDLDYNFISAKPKLNPLLRETQLQQEKTPTTLKLCYRCHRPGHLAKTCRLKQTSTQDTNLQFCSSINEANIEVNKDFCFTSKSFDINDMEVEVIDQFVSNQKKTPENPPLSKLLSPVVSTKQTEKKCVLNYDSESDHINDRANDSIEDVQDFCNSRSA